MPDKTTSDSVNVCIGDLMMCTRNPYDHHKKAGNQGDICKHVALVAALDETIRRASRSPFRFADLFAGYAKNPIRKGKEWSKGIAKVAGEQLFKGNHHVKLWATLSGLDHVPRLDGIYPGSAWFAMQVSEHRDRALELSLWDTDAEPFEDLQTTFPNPHDIFNRAAIPNEDAIKSADFIFIDPPDKKCWATIREHIGNLGASQSMMIWLPITVNTHQTPPVEDKMSSQCRSDFFHALINPEDGLPRDAGSTIIRWAKSGRTIGCQLLYCVNAQAQEAIREAVDEVARIAEYRPEHYNR